MSNMKKETKTKLIKIAIIVGALILLVLAIYLPLELTGTIEKIDSAEKLRDVILAGGAYSYIIFIVIQFLQVTFLPLPAVVTTVAGTLVFGPWITFGLSLLAVMLGSIFAFFLGRKVGRKLVVWVAGEKDAKKWEEKLSRGKYVYFLTMLFPIFPDDILCIVAGCIGMNWKFFLITNIITRPISIGTTCFFGSGQIIPYSGWGIPVWIVLFILACVVFYLSFKYQQQIENFVTNLASKMSRRKADNNNSKTTIAVASIENKSQEDQKDEEIENNNELSTTSTDNFDKDENKAENKNNEIEKIKENSNENNIENNEINKENSIKNNDNNTDY